MSCCAEYQPGGADPVSSSAIAISEGTVFTPSGKAYPFPVPRALDISEVPGIVKSYADGAKNSLAAGESLTASRELRSSACAGISSLLLRNMCCLGRISWRGDPRRKWLPHRSVSEIQCEQAHRQIRGFNPKPRPLCPGGPPIHFHPSLLTVYLLIPTIGPSLHVLRQLFL